MRIAWFGPLPPLKSGISEYGQTALEGLALRAEVDLWVDGWTPSPELAAGRRVFDYLLRPELADLLPTYDAILYNVGNSAQHHGGIVATLRRHPGVVILHEPVLHHFHADDWMIRARDPAGYLEQMRRLYGPAAEARARDGLEGRRPPIWETDEVAGYPLCEDIAAAALGVITHSEHARRIVAPHARGPVAVLAQPRLQVPPPTGSRRELGLPEDRLLLMSYGFVNPNKRAVAVLEAMAAEPALRRDAVYVLIGEVSPQVGLDEAAARLGLSADQVRAVGYQPLETACAMLGCADVCVNLRNPTLGETSAGLLQIMALGRPALVTDAGWYAELPDDAVVKIDPADEAAQLRQRLRELAGDRARRERIGRAAREHVAARHGLGDFLTGLLEFAARTGGARPDGVYWRLADRVSDELLAMGGFGPVVAGRVAEAMAWAPEVR